MIVYKCDQCSAVIDRDEPGWFGVDHVEDDGEVVQFDDIHRFHFHSADCLMLWAMERSYHPSEEST